MPEIQNVFQNSTLLINCAIIMLCKDLTPDLPCVGQDLTCLEQYFTSLFKSEDLKQDVLSTGLSIQDVYFTGEVLTKT